MLDFSEFLLDFALVMSSPKDLPSSSFVNLPLRRASFRSERENSSLNAFSLFIWSDRRWRSTSDFRDDDDVRGVSGRDRTARGSSEKLDRRRIASFLGFENEGELDSGSKSRPINLATTLGVFVPGELIQLLLSE